MDGPGLDVAPVIPDGIELVNGQKGPESIAVDDHFVYWTNQEDDHVMKIPKDQSGPAVLIHQNDNGSVKSIAVDEAHVFWGESLLYEQDKITGQIQSFDLAADVVGNLVIALGRVFWVGWHQDVSSNEIGSMLPDHTGIVQVLPPQAVRINFATDGTTVYFYTPFTQGDDSGVIYTVPASGGTPTLFATTRFPCQVIVDDQYVYWLEGRLANGSVMKKPKTGTPDAGDVSALAQNVGINEPQSMAADGDALYWTQLGVGAGGGAIGKVSKTGGDAHFIANNQVVPQGIAVDDQSVYWVNYGPTYNGTVRKIAK